MSRIVSKRMGRRPAEGVWRRSPAPLALLAFLVTAATAVPAARAGWEPVSPVLDESWGTPFALLADPVTPETWILATPRGVAESTDNGQSFEFRPFLIGSRRLASMVIDPDEPARLWGTSVEAGGVCGLVRSDNRGTSWTEIARLPGDYGYYWWLADVATGGSELLGVHRYAVGCSGSSSQLYRSTDGGATWAEAILGSGEACVARRPGSNEVWAGFQNDGLYRSSDSGVTWQQAMPANVQAMAVGATTDQKIVFRTSDYERGSRIMASQDSGSSWTDITDDFGVYSAYLSYYSTADRLAISGNEIFCSVESGYPEYGTVPILRRAGSGWLPAAWGYPATAGSTDALVFAWWETATPYALTLANDGSRRLYRYRTGDVPPIIALAGWLPDRIEAAAGGETDLVAYAIDPDGDPVTVELLYRGLPTGVVLADAGDGLHRLHLALGPGAIEPGHVMVELVATDSTGRSSAIWPSLAVGSGGPPPAWEPAPWRGVPGPHADSAHPYIMAGGWGFTAAIGERPKVFNLVALIDDPDGIGDLNAIEVMWQGLPTGWVLDEGYRTRSWAYYHGDFARLPMSFGQAWDDTALPEGTYWLELQARDEAGHRSGLWPYLTVE